MSVVFTTSEIYSSLLSEFSLRDFEIFHHNERVHCCYVSEVVPDEAALRTSIGKQFPEYSPESIVLRRFPFLPMGEDGRVDLSILKAQTYVFPEKIEGLKSIISRNGAFEEFAVNLGEQIERQPPIHLDDVPGLGKKQEKGRSGKAQVDSSDAGDALSGQRNDKAGITTLHPLAIHPDESFLLTDHLLETAAKHPTHGINFIDFGHSESHMSYPELVKGAAHVLSGFRGRGLQPGDKVIFQLGKLQDTVTAFWACIMGGFIAVPLPIPPSFSTDNDALKKLGNIYQLLDDPFILTDRAHAGTIQAFQHSRSNASFQNASIEDFAQLAPDHAYHAPHCDDTVLFLFTSGSTGLPKCIQLSHKNIVSRSLGSAQLNRFTPEDRSLNWMPLDHVGGIVMFHARDVIVGCPQIQGRIDLVVADPLLWMEWINRFKVSITWAPNFAFALVVGEIDKLHDKAWDLSSVKHILNGGEAVSADIARRFLKALSPFGMGAGVIFPAYGMSETTSGIVHSPHFDLDHNTGIVTVDKGSMGQRLVLADPGSENAQSFTEVGPPIPGVQIRITDRSNGVIPENHIGRVQVKGPTITKGYYQNPVANEAFLEDGWFNTGDLGFLRDGRLSITGREKDIIIVNGVNYHNYELEAFVERVPGVAPAGVAACGILDSVTGTEKLVLFVVLQDDFAAEPVSIIKEIRKVLIQKSGLLADTILPVPAEQFPRTGIGKKQHAKLSQRYLAGAFQAEIKAIDLLLENERTVPNWFLEPAWFPKAPRSEKENGFSGLTLLFAEETESALKLSQALSEGGGKTVCVCPGSEFSHAGDKFTLNPRSREDYHRLLEATGMPERILHMWNFGQSLDADADIIDQQYSGTFSLLFLLSAVVKLQPDALSLLVLSDGTQYVQPGDTLAPSKGTLPGFLKTASLEMPWLDVCHLDLPKKAPVPPELLLREFQEKDPEVAYRNGQRMVMGMKRIKPEVQASKKYPIKKGGLYLITGGLGDIGFHIGQELITRFGAKLLLTGRTDLNADQVPSDYLYARPKVIEERNKAYKSLKLLSEEVMYRAIDAGDFEGLEAFVEEGEGKWGCQLDGIIHSAGVGNPEYHLEHIQDHMIAAEQVATYEWMFQAKVRGTLALSQLLDDRPAAHFIVFSSISGFFGGASFSAYSAANSFQDRYALHLHHEHGKKVSVFDWSTWMETGINRNNKLITATAAKGYINMLPWQGVNSFLLGLGLPQPQVVLGLDQNNFHIRQHLLDAPLPSQQVSIFTAPSPETAVAHEVEQLLGQDTVFELVDVPHIPRFENGEPNWKMLRENAQRESFRPYVAPSTPLQTQLAEVFKSVLGQKRVGIHDNFFELGGHSLKATRVVSRIQKDLRLSINLGDLFQQPTIAGLEVILEKGPSSEGAELRPLAAQPHYTVSYAQQRLWIQSQLEDVGTLFNIPFAYTFTGPLQVELMEKAVQALVERHESLRTRFILADGDPRQEILSAPKGIFHFHDLLHEHDPHRIAEQVAQKELNREFQLESEALIRVTAMRVEAETHVLVFVIHHIVFDGWSLSVFVKELLHNYNTLLKEGALANAPLHIQYKDYSSWQAERVESEQLSHQLDYWKRKLSGDLPRLNLPLDFARPEARTFPGRINECMLGPALTKELRQLCQSEKASFFMVLVATVNALLHRYTQNEDIILGTPVAGRTHTDLEDQIGFYINTLPLRNQIDSRMSFRQLLGVVKDSATQAFDNQEYPFDKLISELNLARDFSRAPLFDVVVVLQNNDQVAWELPDLDIRPYPLERNTVMWDLEITLTEYADDIHVMFRYNTDLFSESRMDRMRDHLVRLFDSVSADPALHLSELDYVPEQEKGLLLEGFALPEPVSKPAGGIVSHFEAQVRAHGDKAAIQAGGTSLSYAELDAQSSQVAHYLQENHGIGRGDIVGILSDRSHLAVVAMLAVAKTGAAWLPIDPELPEERLQFMLEDAQVKALLLHSDYLFKIESFSGPLFALDLQIDGLDQVAAETNWPNDPEAPAYVTYTSGSTGRAKGVVVPHRGVLRLVKEANYFQAGPKDRILSLSGFYFDGSTFDLFAPLLNGGLCVIADKETILDFEALGRLIKDSGITACFITTALFNSAVDHAPSIFSPLRTLLFGGEKVSLRHAHRFLELHGPDKLIHVYGPTENTTFSTFFPVRTLSTDSNTVPIGQPVSNTQVYVLDDSLNPVGIGVEGQICLGGEGLALGYLNAEAETAAKFVGNPHREGEILYLTGDLGSWDVSGNIVFHRRIDDQVKFRGFRIELGEIENLLQQREDLESAAVLLFKSEDGESKLVAYCAAKEDPGKREIQKWLETRLPPYMIPGQIVHMDELPLNANGKIDKKALLKAGIPAGEASGEAEGPRNAVEQELVGLWKELLGLSELSICDNYFTIGGDSIKAIKLVNALNQTMGLSLGVKDLFQYQDIAALAEHIQSESAQKRGPKEDFGAEMVASAKADILADPSLSALLPDGWEDFYPLSDIQQGMIFHNLLDQESGVYHVQILFQFRDDAFELERYRTAFSLLLEKHEILRTSFHLDGFSEPIQVVNALEHMSYDLPLEDISEMDYASQQSHINAFLAADRQVPFELQKAGLWRIRFYKTATGQYTFLWIFHHAILDGWSDASFMKEFINTAYQLRTDPTHVPRALKASYKDFVIDQINTRNSLKIQNWWREKMEGYARLPLPLQHAPNQAPQSNHKRSYSKELDPALQESLVELSRQSQVNIKDIFVSAFAWLLKLSTGQEDIVFGLLTHGRPEMEDGDRITGCFLNSVPLRLQFPRMARLGEMLKRTSKLMSELKSYDKLSLLRICDLIGEDSSRSNPIFDVFFGYLDFHVYEEAAEESEVKQSDIAEHAVTNTLLDFVVQWRAGRIRTLINASEELYEEHELARLTHWFTRILESMVADLKTELDHAEVLEATEVEQLLHAFNPAPVASPLASTLPEQFRAIVAEHEDAPAVVFQGHCLSYVELDRRSNQVAHFLRKAGVVPDSIVGISMDRSPEILVAILGVVKAGGAYLPIDPNYPSERISYMVQDSGLEWLLIDKAENAISLDGGEHSVQQIEIHAPVIQSSPDQALAVVSGPRSLAYVIYTSGSTGKPKGVQIEQRSLLNLCHWHQDVYQVDSNSRATMYAGIGFDACVWEIWPYLLSGACLYPVEEALKLELGALAEFYKRHEITHTFLPTAICEQLSLAQDLEMPESLWLLTGGDKLQHVDLDRFNVVNNYGPTEFTVVGTALPLRENKWANVLPIGKPVTNSKAYVLDDSGQLLPIGVPGELHLAGLGLARGYLNKPNLTSEKFIHNRQTGERMYRTGDMVRWLPDGNLQFLGRKDKQIQIRAYRVELGEIEHHLQRSGLVREATLTIADDSSAGGAGIFAHVVPNADYEEAALLEWLGRFLPEYMLPRAILTHAAFPLTPNDKIDRKALQAAVGMHSLSKVSFEPPRGAQEEALAQCWRELLHREEIGRSDNFFGLGGDSIKAIQLSSKLRERGLQFNIRDLYAYPTLAGLAATLQAAVAHSQTHFDGLAPLTPIQIDFFNGQKASLSHFNQSTMLHRPEGIRAELLEPVLEKLCQVHSALSSRFPNGLDGGQDFSAASVKAFDLEVLDLASDPDALSKLNSHAQQLQKDFDLEQGPLLRAGLYHTDQGSFLALIAHHLVVDSVSWRIVIQDLEAAYLAVENNRPYQIQPESSSFGHWSEWLASYSQDGLPDWEARYWQEALQLVNAPVIDGDFEQPRRYAELNHVPVAFPEQVSAGIAGPAHHAYQTRPLDLLLAAFARAFQRWGQASIVPLELEGHGRNPLPGSPDISRTVGWFTVLYPIYLELQEGETLSETIRKTKEVLRRVPEQGLGYGLLKHFANAQLPSHTSPAIAFNYLGEWGEPSEQSGFKSSEVSTGDDAGPDAVIDYSLLIHGSIQRGALDFTFVHHPEELAPEAVQNLVQLFQEALEEVVAHCLAVPDQVYSPSDFGDASLSLDQFDLLQKRYPDNIRSISHLTPIQEGILYHHALDSESQIYFEQFSFLLEGSVDPSLLQQAFQEMMASHGILRSAFLSEGLERPRMVELDRVPLQFTVRDFSNLPAEEAQTACAQLKIQDRENGFDLVKGELMRVHLILLGEQVMVMWSYHHILLDGWSMGILVKELFERYGSLVAGEKGADIAPRPFPDYIDWLEKRSSEKDASYWADYLEGYNETASLPKSQLSKAAPVSALHEFSISPELSRELESVAKELGVTTSAFIQTCWALLLQRYNDRDDVCFGSVVAGRPADLRGVENMVGIFINTLPLRVQAGQGATFLELVQATHATASEVAIHGYHPLAAIQAAHPLHQNLLDHVLVFENYPLDSDVLNPDPERMGFELKDIEVWEQINYDFGMNIIPGERLSFRFNYNGSAFSKEFMLQVADHFCALIAAATAEPAEEAGKLAMLDAQGLAQLHAFASPHALAPATHSIVSLFKKQVAAQPEQTAVLAGDRKLTYAELDRKSDLLAHYLLSECNLRPNNPVGIFLAPSIDHLVATLGILKAGGAYVPIDIDYPPHRVELMFADTGMRVLVTDSERLFDLDGFEGSLFAIDIQLDLIEAPEAAVSLEIDPSQLAYVMYTSGSTGRPKGVMVPHCAVVRLVHGSNFFELKPGERLLQTSSMSFDASTFELWASLLNGGTLVLTSKKDLLEPRLFEALLREHDISTAWLTSSWFNQLVEVQPELFSPLRHLLVGGEALSPKHVNAVRERFPELRITNGYGPTENTTFSATFDITEPHHLSIPIGRPISQSEVYVLDRHQNPQPIGAIGEICVAGHGLALGYLNDTELTDRKFVSHPFRADSRMYKTGDLGKWNADGTLRFLGRMDSQVKIRGHRIEPGEIENVLKIHGNLQEVIVLVVDSQELEKELFVFYTSEQPFESNDLKAWLGQRLPAYLVPDKWRYIEQMPLNANGKADRKKLAALAAEAGFSESAIEAPVGELEIAVAGIWKEILGLEQLGRKQNFFEVGGHSLKATHLSARIYRTLSLRISIQDIFNRQTVAEQAAFLAELQEDSYQAIPAAAKQDSYDLSHAQKRLWIFDQADEEGTAYNIPGAFRLKGIISAEGIRMAFQQLLDRHESLRTNFLSLLDVPQQVIREEVDFELEFEDLSGEAAPEDAALRLAMEEAAFPFDLMLDVLVRAKLLKLGESDHILLVTFHHIVSDGWSFDIILRELSHFYKLHQGAELPDLPSLSIHYKDYALWQHKSSQSSQVMGMKQWWLDQFPGEIPKLELPYDFPRPASKSHAGEILEFTLDKEVHGQLLQLGRDHGASLFMVLQSIVLVLMNRYSGQEDIVLGTPTSGRTHPDLEHQVGYFLNTLPLPNHVDPHISFVSFLEEVKDRTLAAFERQQFPFEKLVEALDIPRDLSRSPLFDVLVVMQNHAQSPLQFGEVEALRFETKISNVKYDLEFTFYEEEDGLLTLMNFNTSLFNGERMRAMAGHFQRLVASILSEPTEQVGRMNLLSQAEKAQLTSFGLGEQREIPVPSIARAFEAAVLREPNAQALFSAEESLTYAELNARSNQLAHYLIAAGIQTNDCVALVLNRSTECIVAMLAILKAGGAYVPIDPSYPAERIQAILSDTGAKVVLTDSEYLFELGDFEGEFFAMDIQMEMLEESTENPALSIAPEDLAYVIFTSGSTGQPKGVMVPQVAVLRLVLNTNFVSIGSDETILQTGTIAFDASTFEVWGALLNGARLRIAGEKGLLDHGQMKKILLEERISTMWITSSWFNQLVDLDLDMFSGLKRILVGGEALSPSHISQLRLANPEIQIINGYGPTENTTFSTTFSIERPYESAIPIGKPIANSEAHILNACLLPQPLGVVGEICVAGLGLAAGYLNDPKLTAEKFVPHFSDPGKRLYRTGDLGKWLPDGTISILGRVDEQLKIRGFRIEPGEVELALLSQPSISKAYVTAREDASGVKTLVAYLVAEGQISSNDLRQSLKEKLPVNSIPSFFIEVESFPLTANGKIDKSRLPNPDGLGLDAGILHVEPRNSIEERLCNIWMELLKLEKVGVHDNFFVLGGDSIKAIVLVTIINKAVGKALEVKHIFEYQTIEELAAYISTETASAAALASLEAAKSAIESLQQEILADPNRKKHLPEGYETFYPQADVQKGMIFHSVMDPGSGVYYDQILHDFTDPHFDFGLFKKAYRLLVGKYEVLRASFHINHFPVPLQVIHPIEQLEFRMEFQDIRHLSGEALTRFLSEFMAEDRKTPFDPEVPGLWRTFVFQIEAEKFVIMRAFHHAILDGWSDASFMSELSRLYSQLKVDPESRPEPIKSTMLDFIVDQERIKSSAEVQDWWRSQMAGYNRTPMPLGKSNPKTSVQLYKDIHSVYLDQDLLEDIRALSGKAQVGVKEIFLAAFTWFIKLTTNVEDVNFGLLTHARPDVEDGDKLVGCFLNSVPFRIALPKDASGEDLLDSVNKHSSQLKSYDKLSLLGISELVDGASDGSNPIFDIFFGYFDFHVYGSADRESRVKQSRLGGHAITNTLFDCFVIWEGEDLRLSFTTLKDIYSPAELSRMSDYYIQILQALVHRGQDLLNLEQFIGSDEQEQLGQFEMGESLPLPMGTVVDLFDASLRKHPHQTAVVHSAGAMDYAELGARSDALAVHLLAQGLQKGDLVALMLPRELDLIVALWAVLKAGCAFVPIDPNYPEKRIQYMLSETEAGFVLQSDEPNDGQFHGIPACSVSAALSSTHSGKFSISRPASEDLAYVIFTSGSTGKPKGVQIRHRNLASLLPNFLHTYGFEAGDRMLASTQVTFDISNLEILGSLALGITVVLASNQELEKPIALAELIQRNHVNLLQFTPSRLQLMLDAVGWEFTAGVKTMLVGGEALPESLKAEMVKRTQIRFINVYGPTETTVWSTSWEVGDGPVFIGRPSANEVVRILSGGMERLPAGVPGEIYIGGPGVGRGYQNRPDLTTERFLPDPFSKDESRLYKTGDWGRWDENGNLDFLGRLDQQVKIRGHRIELGEIDSVLLTYPGVNRAISMVQSPHSTPYLCAYYLAEGEIDATGLKAHLAAELPGYMIPAHFILLDEFPLNNSGKIDRFALPVPDVASTVAYEAPDSPSEMMLAEMFGEVLGLERVGRNAEFFSLGGDSIKALLMASKLFEQGIEIEIAAIFRHSELSQLAMHIDGLTTGKEDGVHQGSLLGSRALEQVLQLNPEALKAAYFQVEVGSEQGFEAELVQRAMASLVDLYPQLQLRIEGEAGAYRLSAGLERSWPLALGQNGENGSQREAFKDLLEGGNLYQVLLGEKSGRHYLKLLIHQCLCDADSAQLLGREFIRIYDSALAGKPVQAGTAKSMEAVAYRAWREGESQESLPVAPLPEDRMFGRMLTKGTGQFRLRLDTGGLGLLLENPLMGPRHSTRDLLVTALAQAMQDWTGGDRVGIVLHQRGHSEKGPAKDLGIGNFSQTIPLTLAPARNGEASKTVQEIRSTISGSLADSSFSKDHLHFSYPLSPLDQTSGALSIDALEQNQPPDRIPPIQFTGIQNGDQIHFTVKYDKSRFREASLRMLGSKFKAVWADIVAQFQTMEVNGTSPAVQGVNSLSQDEIGSILSSLKSGEQDKEHGN